VDAVRAEEALSDLVDLRLVRHGHAPLLHRVWELRGNLSAYDAVYVALAEALEAPLLTMDQKLLNAPGHAVHVIVP
jgi:predicted nucleic acid-binding protein